MAKLPVLMYHNVVDSTNESEGLTVSVSKLEEQFAYLKSHGYTSLHFKDLSAFKSEADFPEKAVIITFDDVYENQLIHAYPLLEKYGLKACFYIPFAYVGGLDDWNTGKEKIMTIDQLKSLNEEIVELGLHSFNHGKYDQISVEAIQEDFDLCREFIQNNSLVVHNTLAYPYGKYPKKGEEQTTFFRLLHENKIGYGLRIGNRVNQYPFKNLYEIQRIDVKGEYDLKTFIKRLKKGKSWF